MIQLEEAIFLYLTNNTEIQNLLVDRIYPIVIPQKENLPSVSYQRVSVDRVPALIKDTGFVKQIMQFNCYGKTYKEAIATSNLVLKVLQDFSGDMEGIFIGATLVISQGVTYNAKTKFYSSNIDFEFQFNEKEE